MPVHDWTRVDAGVFHDFHNSWITELRKSLNGGILPKGYYAMTEQHAGSYITDVLTLHAPSRKPPARVPAGGVAVADAPPRVRHSLSLSNGARSRRKTLTIRHASGHRIVALLEMVPPANKDRRRHADEFLSKLADALAQGIHVLLVDLFPPGPRDPKGMHGALWQCLGDKPKPLPPGEPLTLCSYVADEPVKAYVEHVAVGKPLPTMPLFLDIDYYINVPLESTYQAAWRGTPEPWRDVLEDGE